MKHAKRSCDGCVSPPDERRWRDPEDGRVFCIACTARKDVLFVKNIHFDNARNEATMEHDKDETKTPFHLVPLDFVAAMAELMREGLKGGKRQPGDWMRLKWTDETRDLYYDALLRHIHRATTDEPSSCDSWLSAACNAMILWYHSKKGKK